MNKLLILAIVTVMAVTLVGCKAKKSDPQADINNGTAQEESVKAKPGDVVQNGDDVKVDYVGSTEADGVFDTSIESVAKEEGIYNEIRSYEPMSFTVGSKSMIPGFENGVLGMKVGETKTITVTPEEGYGQVREDLVKDLPKSNFTEQGVDPKVGETYNFGMAQGKVLEVTDETIKIDFNHFLAGKTLTFEVTVRDIIRGNQQKAEEAPANN